MQCIMGNVFYMVTVNRILDKSFWCCFKLWNVFSCRSSSLTEKSLCMVRKSFHSFWILSSCSSVGKVAGMSIFEKTTSFSGPVSIHHFSCLDCLPIQNLFPDIPICFNQYSNILIWVSLSRLWTCNVWFTLYIVGSDPIRSVCHLEKHM